MAIREGRWDCPSCGSTAIYGRHVDCPGCGKPRPAGVRFYLTADAPVVTDPEQLKEAKAGPDWVCLHCEASNRATLTQCGGCGAERGSSPAQPVVRYGEGQAPTAGALAAPPALLGAAAIIRRPAEPEPERKKRRNVAGWVAGGLIGAVVMGGIIDEREPRRRVTTPVPVPAVVEDVRWERLVLVEARTLVPGEGWELPDSALNVQQSSRVLEHRQKLAGHHTIQRVQPRRVQEAVGEHRVWQAASSSTSCETVDMGNGYFEEKCEESGGGGEWVTETEYRTRTVYDTIIEQRPYYESVPVHAPYYSYRVPMWQTVDTVRATGGLDTPPAWPRAEVAPGRRTSQEARYEVVVRQADGTREAITVSDDTEWRGFRRGQPIAYARAGGNRYFAGLFPRDSLPECRTWHAGRGKPPPDSLGCSPRRARQR
jgi:hypothetical protein